MIANVSFRAGLVMSTTMLVTGTAAAKDPVSASRALCRPDSPIVAHTSADAMMGEADALQTSELDRARARSIYLAILARDETDDDAAIGLARTDAADQCYGLAEAGYREVLKRTPNNVDARAGLVDVLLWTHRWREAQRELDDGLYWEPFSPELLSRRARVAYYRGDATAAAFWIAEAENVSPLDPEVNEAKRRIHVGQARLGQRIQLFPSGYDNLYTTDVSGLQRWKQWRFEFGGTVVTRHGAPHASRSGDVRSTLIDGRPSGGAYYHFGNGQWAGVNASMSAPALALPRWTLGAGAFTPLGLKFSLEGEVGLWHYRDDRDVLILSPALGYALTGSIDLTLRYWLTTVFLPNGDSSSVHSIGLRVGWRPIERLALGLDYTYGVQLERNPTALELLDLRSHIISLIALWLFDRTWGIDGSVSAEYRMSDRAPNAWGPAAEVGIFVRW